MYARLSGWALFVSAFVCCLGLSTSARAQVGTLAGSVVDQQTGSGISGATVSSGSRQTVTDAQGHYTLTQVSPSAASVSAAAPRYDSNSVAINVTNWVTGSVPTISLKPQPNTIFWNGSNRFLAGNNYAWWNYGTDFGTGGFGKYTNFSQISSDFATMNQQQVKVVRWFLFADGRYSPEFSSAGAVTGLDGQFFADIDTALQIAHNNHVYLIFDLIDFLMWTSPQTSGSVTGGGHSALVTDASVQQSYLDNALKPLLQHIAASPYRAQVLAYDIVNEPEYAINEIRGGGLPLAQVQTFVQNCASYIHQYGGGAYATLGSGTPSWVGYWKGMGLDFYQIHYYPNFDPAGPGSGLPTYASLNLDKPCIVGEFATNDNSYTVGDTTPLSAQWYLDTIYKYGYAGALGWSYEYIDNEGNWNAFAPVFTNWVNGHSAIAGQN